MTRRVNADVNNRVEAQQLQEGEIMMVIGDETRRAFLEWVGRTSPNDMAAKNLTDRQRQLIIGFYYMVQ